MKIVYIVRQIDASGGRERVLVNKANYFVDKCGYDVTILTMFQQSDASFFGPSGNGVGSSGRLRGPLGG
jgi:hypothetical protein